MQMIYTAINYLIGTTKMLCWLSVIGRVFLTDRENKIYGDCWQHRERIRNL